MGSEMCIRDRRGTQLDAAGEARRRGGRDGVRRAGREGDSRGRGCLLYTSDAADERSSVDLGGRRIIKKKKDDRRQHACTGNI